MDIYPISKICTKCNIEKSLVEFSPRNNSNYGFGYHSHCKVCQNLSKKEYYIKNKSKIDKRAAKYRSENIERVKLQNKETNLKRLYGITLEDFNNLLESQHGCCAICKTNQTHHKNTLHVDHDHKTGKIRGLLCHNCNVALGLLKDSKELLSEAISYLTK